MTELEHELLEALKEYAYGSPCANDIRLCLLTMNAYGKPEMTEIPAAMEARELRARAVIAKAEKEVGIAANR